MKRLQVFLVLAAAGTARAQTMAMPDVREMSGIPRPDEKVEAGLLTVRVVHGELGKNAAQGTLVHLVGLSADGKVAKTTVAVNDEGRAEFPGLARDGTVAYYALCLLGDDRLESDVVTLPPQVGVRLMLAGRKLDKDGKPIGPPIDDARRGLAPDAPEVAPGTAEIAVRGRVRAPKVRVVELGGGVAGEAEGDDEGLARVAGLRAGAERVYIGELDAFGRTFRTPPFMMSPAAGVTRLLVAHDRLLMALQGGAVLEDNGMSFELQIALINATGMPYDTGPDGLVLPLPVGSRAPSMPNEMRRITADPDRGIVWKGVVPPGQNEVVVRFFLPSENGETRFSMPAPLGVFTGSVAIEKVPGMDVRAGTGNVAPDTRRGEDGREFLVLRELRAEQGSALSFAVSGLPVEPAGNKRARLLVGLLVALLLGVAVAASVWPRPSDTGPEGRTDLEKRRDRLYDELVALERSKMAGKVGGERYQTRRRDLVAKLVLVHRQIDETTKPAPPKSASR